MRTVHTNVIPANVNRYLAPDERMVITLHQHPGVLVPSAAAATGGLLAAITASIISGGNEISKQIVWILIAFLVLRFLLATYSWSVQVIVITNRRLILISGIASRKVSYTELPDLKKMTFERSFAGLMLGYGTYKIGPDGAGQLIIKYIPYSEQIIGELSGLLDEDE